MLAELSLEPEHRRGHGALYGAVNRGRIDIARLRRALAGLPLPAWDDGRIRLAADVSNWLRPDAATSPDRLFCHCYARGRGNAQMIPGWPYSVIAALEPGRTSWTLPLDAVRLGPADDATAVTAAQVREVVTRIIAAGHWRDGDPDILVVFDAGYDLTRLAWLLRDLPAEVTGRLRSDRVMYFPLRRASPAPTAAPSGTGPRSSSPTRRARPPRRRPPAPRRPGTAPPGPRPGAGCASSWPPRRVGRSRWRAAHRRGHPHPAAGRSPARRPQPRAAVAVVLTRPDLRRRDRPRLAGVPAPLRYRTHVQVLQAGPRLDPAEAAGPGRRRPVDLDHPGLLRPAPARPPPRRRPAPALAAARARPAELTPPPGSAAGSGTSARCCPARPARRNPANPAPAARPDRRTAARPPATTWAKPSNGRSQRRTAGRRLK